ncbi:MAG: flagellar hook-basal body complex protein FliE [Alphaproteobacteria bacterium]|nr:flagellar hook-basal body complex protein FliE [Alphaproteobacteria bacterium]
MSDLGISAAKAYLQTAQTLASTQSKPMEGMSGPGFGDILNTAVSTISKSGASAESAITKAAMGRGDLVDVVTAVAAAEATLETVIAVRDEVIKAYQDIMRMPI